MISDLIMKVHLSEYIYSDNGNNQYDDNILLTAAVEVALVPLTDNSTNRSVTIG
jgi:hypothetical protein